MLNSHEKTRCADDTREIAQAVLRLMEKVKGMLPEEYHYTPGPVTDLRDVYNRLTDIVARFEGK